MELKKKVVKEIADENNIWVDFSELQEMVEHDGSNTVHTHHELNHENIYQIDMDESSALDFGHSSPRNGNSCDISNSDGSNNGYSE